MLMMPPCLHPSNCDEFAGGAGPGRLMKQACQKEGRCPCG